MQHDAWSTAPIIKNSQFCTQSSYDDMHLYTDDARLCKGLQETHSNSHQGYDLVLLELQLLLCTKITTADRVSYRNAFHRRNDPTGIAKEPSFRSTTGDLIWTSLVNPHLLNLHVLTGQKTNGLAWPIGRMTMGTPKQIPIAVPAQNYQIWLNRIWAR